MIAALKAKGLMLGALALAAAIAWGAFGWMGKARVERDFEAYRGQQARLVTRQQESIIAEQQRAATLAQEASHAYQEGARTIRARWDAERLRNRGAGVGGRPLSATAQPASGLDAAPCEERLSAGLREVAELRRSLGVDLADALRDAELAASQLAQLQAFNCGRSP